MTRWPRVLWTGHRSEVYHAAAGLVYSDHNTRARCGALVSTRLYRPEWGSAWTAAQLGLRPCRKCWSRPDVTQLPGYRPGIGD